eukprot:TRINITY_DN18045_c0_g1_i2.p1 TRINITY_DN18045_c0_g1~~TRINITY_DN18045_c0_g1_i2.p1  ORF type:complete len:190 (-),score=34.19 TRINITY_DN18045_c0_g1_i2:10-579(-)
MALAQKNADIEFDIKKVRSGWNYGYSKLVKTSFDTALKFVRTHTLQEMIDCRPPCASYSYPFARKDHLVDGDVNIATDYPVPRQPESLDRYAIWLKVSMPTVSETMKLGILPQLFELLSSVGGYFTVIGIVWGLLFWKKYPDSQVAQAYDTLTIAGNCSTKPLMLEEVQADLRETAASASDSDNEGQSN